MELYDGPIIDVDVHHSWFPNEILEYLPARWRAYVAETPSRMNPPTHTSAVTPNGGRMLEALEPGFSRGTDYGLLCKTLLDRHGYYRLVLTHDVGQFGGHLNPEFAIAAARAANDWNIERWLGRDERFYSVVVIPSGQPEAAAEEIRRVGGHERLVSVCLAGNTLGRPFGDPVYDPIYRAASEMGLHIALHYGAYDRPTSGVTAVGGNLPSGIFSFSQFSQQAMSYIASYVVNGTFERFPGMKVLVKEYGVAWLPWLIARLDDDYHLMKVEMSNVKRWPREYIHSNVKLSTQPLEESPKHSNLHDILSMVDGIEDVLCFSSDWPHWTADDPDYVSRLLPRSWLRKVFCDNACDFFGWPAPTEWSRAKITGAGARA